ncbi:MAG: hypothetical protein HY680_06675 [Chloroflexi bacterium]|nr:hypothetical protein [Chloroflexota bacterium]
MRTFRLAMAQINPTVGDLEGNAAKIIAYLEEARSLGADLVAFPELALIEPSLPKHPREQALIMEATPALTGDEHACNVYWCL